MQLKSAAGQQLSLLVVEENAERRIEIVKGLQTYGPKPKIEFSATAEDALKYLYKRQAERASPVHLVLLNLDLPTAQQGLELLKIIRTTYLQLPVAVFSTDQLPETVLKAYQLGANSFSRTPADPDQWQKDFKGLADYWLQTVLLPNTISLF